MRTRQIYRKLSALVLFLCMTLVLSGCGRIANHPLVNMAKEEVAINSNTTSRIAPTTEFTPNIAPKKFAIAFICSNL